MDKRIFEPENLDERTYIYIPGFTVASSPTGKEIPPHLWAEWKDERGRICKDIARVYNGVPPTDEYILADVALLRAMDRTGF